MAQLGRNEHCHCGSGKKYKKCCLAKDEAAAPPKPAAAQDAARRVELARLAQIADAAQAADELDELSNQVPALLRAGRLDEAEAVCSTLKEKYPDQIDWLERGALVAKARGDNKGAADLYRRCVAFTREHDGFDEGLRDWMIGEIEKLDPGSSVTV